ncbi:Glycylpeptide N-tetradecanoyltransferase [Colletotrichum tanaceti]|uniref:Glycylpeptide N-tetradecanoyltransferase n=1 Tax=Colletotrichum tanaceti TaxID=1306861 RepID=A0A4U6XQX9_9PEZI|nr:Glycylpeptide N-tetradecanoyltransferase [Colletotrichum tanaceti]TKW58237.1 Glycylpeptide N-tetradecanoyltransferase [Colletotrichum tanaceti]
MPAEESKPLDPAVKEANDALAEATDKGKGKGKEPEVESDEEDAEEDVPEEAAPGASAAGAKKKKKKSKRKKVKEALTGQPSDPEQKIKEAIGGLTPQQLTELLSLNPALANELGVGSSSNKSAEETAAAMQKLDLQDIMTGLASAGKNAKDMASYKFWATQPVPKFGESEKKIEDGPIRVQTVEEVPTEPSPMVTGFEWVTMNLEDDGEMKEVYELLNGHYVEDDEAMFRFNYSPAMLRWALMAPGWRKEWHVGVRASQSRKLVAFISAIPVDLRVRKNVVTCSEVNFMVVHKKLRGKRLAPVLIKEITRRSNLRGIWQGLYTGGVVLPKPVSTCRYFHRALNWQKLYEVGFSPLPPNSKPQYQIRKYQLPDATSTKGLRELQEKDIDAARELLTKYLKRFDMAPEFSNDEFRHWFLHDKNAPGEQVIWTYVVETNGKITDMFSFYCLESTVINSSKHQVVRAAYLWYYASDVAFATPFNKDALKTRLNSLIGDALVMGKKYKFDVFNGLSLLDNGLFLEQQKFGPGDGQLHYYLFNYRAAPIAGGVDMRNRLDEENLSGIGLVML